MAFTSAEIFGGVIDATNFYGSLSNSTTIPTDAIVKCPLSNCTSPTILTRVNPEAKVMRDEIFAPVVSIAPFREFDEAIALVNGTPYGLQAGVFTRDIERALTATQRLEVGGVIINGTSSTRADLMPYGGTKESGFGKEGPKYSLDEMTEVRVVVFKR